MLTVNEIKTEIEKLDTEIVEATRNNHWQTAVELNAARILLYRELVKVLETAKVA